MIVFTLKGVTTPDMSGGFQLLAILFIIFIPLFFPISFYFLPVVFKFLL